jgi:hypothetical protein
MLELDYPTTLCLHVCDVLLTGFGVLDNLLPVVGKPVFPSAVPVCFVLPPRVAAAASLVSPMPAPDFSALGNHRAIAIRIRTLA